MKKTAMENLIHKYIDRIEIEYTNIWPNRTYPEGAILNIIMPRGMIEEYLAIRKMETLDFYLEKEKNKQQKLPDPVDFWNKSMLDYALRNSGKSAKYGNADLNEVLDFFRFRMVSRFTEIHVRGSESISMTVQNKDGPYGDD